MNKPSPFAVSRKYKGKVIVDLGCGNGRDTKFFKKTGNKCIGLDLIAPKGPNFIRGDVKSYLVDPGFKIDVVYCRFFFHRIKEDLETKIIQWAYDQAPEIAIEARAEGDKPLLYPKHWRRFINPARLIRKLMDAGYTDIHCTIGHGLAKFKNEDPWIVRVIGKR